MEIFVDKRVKHPQLGLGKIVEIFLSRSTEAYCQVMFDSGSLVTVTQTELKDAPHS